MDELERLRILLPKSKILVNKSAYISKAPKWRDKLKKFLEEEENKLLWTSFLSQHSSEVEAWYCLIHNDSPFNHKCKVCGENSLFLQNRYIDFCSNKCRNINRESRKKETCLEKYGFESPNKNIQEKRRRTCLEKYGTFHPLQNKDIQDKIRQTCLRKYKETSFSKTNLFKEKYKNTSLHKFGTSNPLQNKEIKEKRKITDQKKYGKDFYSSTKEFQQKYKQTCLDKYGVNNPLQYKEIKSKVDKAIKERYGVENISQNQEIKNKKKLAYLNHYGVDSYSKTVECARTRGKKWKVEGNYFDSKPEIYFEYYLLDSGIPFEKQIPIKYKDSLAKEHIYFCDFKRLDTNQLIEIKGKHLMKESNLFNPFYLNCLRIGEEKL